MNTKAKARLLQYLNTDIRGHLAAGHMNYHIDAGKLDAALAYAEPPRRIHPKSVPFGPLSVQYVKE